jgi:hypothetical protein
MLRRPPVVVSMNQSHLIAVVIAALSSCCAFSVQADETGTEQKASSTRPKIIASPATDVTTSTREGYRKTIDELEATRRDIRRRYLAATTRSDSDAQTQLIGEARSSVFAALVEKIFPAWYGTPWDFNGVTQTPGEGMIACGYFVTTTLRDAGFDLPRIKLAQQASQTIIHSLTGRESISINAGKPLADIEEHIRTSGVGLYIVGLDTHVGFVVNDGQALAFVHSSYYTPPRKVVAEPTNSVNPLRDSNYRVVGKILDDTMMKKWILGGSFSLNERR